ncbi:zinc finger, CCHC-type containing protein, partial [Tanacetum coccineum]
VVVRLPDPKLKTLGERGTECIFVGYAEHSKAFRLGGSVVPEVVVQQPKPELRKGKRNRTPKNFGPEFQLYLFEGTRDDVSDQHSYCLNVEDDPKIFDDAIKSRDVAFWKEVINDEMDSIMGNNTWVWLIYLQKSRINYFDTYALVARINTLRLLIAMTSIQNLIIHLMDVKTSFLNGELDEEVYMNQPQGFIMTGNENKACKLTKSLYGLKQAPKQWHQKFDEVENSRPNFNYNSGPTFIRTVNANGPQGRPKPAKAWYKDQLEDFEEFNGGSVTFGGSKGYISGKGRIRVGGFEGHQDLYCLLCYLFALTQKHQENDAVAPSQPSSSSPPVASTSSPPVITTPTPIPASITSPTPIPET